MAKEITEPKVKECSVRRGIVYYCDSLGRSIDEKAVRICVINDEKLKIRGTMIVLHSGGAKRKKRGVLMNFCPFCGKSIS